MAVTRCGKCDFWRDVKGDWGKCVNHDSEYYGQKTDKNWSCVEGEPKKENGGLEDVEVL